MALQIKGYYRSTIPLIHTMVIDTRTMRVFVKTVFASRFYHQYEYN